MKNILLLVLTAVIWGFAFVAQKEGMEHIGPFAFNGIRFLLGSLSLLPLLLFQKPVYNLSVKRTNTVLTLKGGVILGFIVFVAAAFQQVGIIKSTAGNAGFITSLYLLIVPVFGFFLKHSISKQVWIGAILAVIGLYFLSFNNKFQMSPGDGLVLISAVFWALHIIVTGYYATRANILILLIVQFLVSGMLNLATAFLFEKTTLSMVLEALYPILYGGIMSIGIAYSLQVVGQRNVAPSKAAIILSLESVFAVFGGWLLLNESITLKKAVGALIILTGLIISQINFKSRKTAIKYR